MGSALSQKYIPPIAILIILILIHSAPATAASLDDRTAYEVLQDYNFPVGLLPEGVKGYDLNIITGEFSVYFDYTCSFEHNHFHLKYNPTVKGSISNGKIFGLNGVYEKRFLLWMEIDQIVRNGDDIVFSVGALSSAFPVTDFEMSPQCGGGGVGKLRANPFVSLFRGS